MEKTAPNSTDKTAKWIVGMGCLVPLACAALLVLLLVGGLIWTSVAGPSEESMAEDFGTACYEDARSQFKDSSSANLTDSGVTALESDGNDPRFEMSGSGSGVNGFGGYSTVTWSCTGFYSKTSDKAYANATVTND